MAKRSGFHFTIPETLLTRLRKYSEDKFKSVASIIIDAIVQFLENEGY